MELVSSSGSTSGVGVTVSIGNNKVMDGKGTNVSVGPGVLVIFGVNVVVILGVVVVVPDLTAVVDTVGSTVPCTVLEGVGVPVAAPAGIVTVGVSDWA